MLPVRRVIPSVAAFATVVVTALTAACGTEGPQPSLPAAPTTAVNPAACSLVSPSSVSDALGGTKYASDYAVIQAPVGGKTRPAGQCTYSVATGGTLILTVFPTSSVASLAAYVVGASPAGHALYQQSASSAILTFQDKTAVVEISLAGTGADASKVAASLVSLAQEVGGPTAAAMPAVTAAPSGSASPGASGSPSASASPSAAASALPGDPGLTVSGQTAASAVSETDQLKFSPTSVTVKVGDVVQWKNTGSVAHNVTFDAFPDITSTTMNANSTYQVKFTQAGTYQFHCTFHPGMDGTVVVSS